MADDRGNHRRKVGDSEFSGPGVRLESGQSRQLVNFGELKGLMAVLLENAKSINSQMRSWANEAQRTWEAWDEAVGMIDSLMGIRQQAGWMANTDAFGAPTRYAKVHKLLRALDEVYRAIKTERSSFVEFHAQGSGKGDKNTQDAYRKTLSAIGDRVEDARKTLKSQIDEAESEFRRLFDGLSVRLDANLERELTELPKHLETC